MATSALTKICCTTIETTEAKYDELIAEREQLRILKNFVKIESTLTKSEIVNLINAMEANNE